MFHADRKAREVKTRIRTIGNLKKWLKKEEEALAEALKKPMSQGEYLFTRWEKEFPLALKKLGGKRDKKDKSFFSYKEIRFEYTYHSTGAGNPFIKIIRKDKSIHVYLQLADDLQHCLDRLAGWTPETCDLLDIYNDTFEVKSFFEKTRQADKNAFAIAVGSEVAQYGNLNVAYF